MQRKGWLLLLWLVASALWIAFAITQLNALTDTGIVETPPSVWTIERIVETGVLLFGLPLALLGVGFAVGWIIAGMRR
ncbi:MAG: hypothetical protein JSR91_27445 [Proteobacteria bacterium]|nr:hypothetical protein [Pseudomonadota bacterium]